jgi:hypothetical protein
MITTIAGSRRGIIVANRSPTLRDEYHKSQPSATASPSKLPKPDNIPQAYLLLPLPEFLQEARFWLGIR